MRCRALVFAILLLCFCVAGQAGASSPISARSVAVGVNSDETGADGPQPTAAPVSNADFTMTASIGYDGLIIMNRWVPAFVSVTNNGPDFDGMLCVNLFLSKTVYDRYEVPLTLANGATKRVPFPILPQTKQDMYAFELIRNGELVAEQRISPARVVAPESLSVGVLSKTPETFAYLNQKSNGVDTLRGETWLTIPLTAEIFPDTTDLMSAFSMLVIDGFDARTLSEAQRYALTDWIRGGGIVFVSGGAKAADGYPFFKQWTDLAPGVPFESEDISAELSQLATIAHKPFDGGVWLAPMPKDGALAEKDGNGLISAHSFGEGLILTAAFDMGGKPFAGWASVSAFWPRLLRAAATDVYQAAIARAESSRYNNDPYRAQNLVNALRVRNGENGFLVLLLLGLYIVCVGFGGYLLLKRLDRREWLWGAAPLAAAVFALLLFLLSRSSDMNKPVALTASRIYMDSEGAQIATYIGIATPESGELMISTDQAKLPLVLTDTYYDDSGDSLYRPAELRQRYLLGSTPKIGFQSNAAWDAKMLKVDHVGDETGGLSGKLWMESDGVHGEIVNEADTLLTGCVVLTPFGYAVPGELLPGQKAQLILKVTDKEIDTNDPKFQFEPDVLYVPLNVDTATLSVMSYNDNLGNFLRAALYGKYNDYNATNTEAERKEALIQLFNDVMPMYNSASAYYCFGFNDSIGKVAVTVGNALVTRTAHTAAIGANLSFEPIGPTGEVFYHPGLIPADVIVDMGDAEKPRMPNETEKSSGSLQYLTKETFLQLDQPIAIRFLLSKKGTFDIERMTLASLIYDATPQMFLFNNETGVWDEQPLVTVSMDGKGWAPYIDKDGALYVRFVPSEAANRYQGMGVPVISLKGKVK